MSEWPSYILKVAWPVSKNLDLAFEVPSPLTTPLPVSRLPGRTADSRQGWDPEHTFLPHKLKICEMKQGSVKGSLGQTQGTLRNSKGILGSVTVCVAVTKCQRVTTQGGKDLCIFKVSET